MKYAITGIMLAILVSAAHADPAKPAPKPPTIESLQAQVAADDKTIKQLSALYQGAIIQRDTAQKALSDNQLQSYALQQTAPAPEAPKPKP